MKTPDVVVGIDPSQTGLGIVAIPVDWGLDFARIKRASFGRPLKNNSPHSALIDLASAIANDVCRWIDWAGAERPARTHIWVEGFLAKGAYRHDRVVRIGSVVEHELARRFGLYTVPVPVASARKLFLSRVPKGAKDIIHNLLNEATPGTFEDGDQADAFIVGNWGLSELGFPCLRAESTTCPAT